MKKVIIPPKHGNTGTIHDIASQHIERQIKFPKGAKYAIVLSSYYGGKGYTTHATESATIQADARQSEFSRQIVGVDGYIYTVNRITSYYGELERVPCDPYEVQSFEEITIAATALGRIKSPLKAITSRINGRKGGRPPTAK